MQKIFYILILLINIFLTENGHALNCADFNSNQDISSLSGNHPVHNPATQDEQPQSGHHCCPVCHTHVVFFSIKDAHPKLIYNVKHSSLIYSYDNFYSFYSIASPFRPPIS